MTEPTLKVLFGPPGTGKTFRAAREAVRLIDPDTEPAQFEARHKRLVDAGRILWVTFHPSYSYEDFVEGFRPEVKEQGITYVPRPGPFRLACERCYQEPGIGAFFEVGQHLEATIGNVYEVTDCDRSALFLKKVRGRGEGLHSPVSFHVVERLISKGYRSGDMSVSGQDYDRKMTISQETGIDAQSLFGMTGPLRAVMAELEKGGYRSQRRAQPVVLVIDEINRADLSRVFGELITLLEPDKRIGSREERRITLPYSQDLFGVPRELHVLATMNTADRSLTLMDLALRRRFDFVEVPPDPGLCADDYGGLDLPALLRSWNRRITALLSRNQQLGHAYLMRERLEGIRLHYGFSSDADGELRTLAVTLKENLIPQLVEYFPDDWRKVDFILGRDFATGRGGILVREDYRDLIQPAEEIIDLSEASDFAFPGFADPFAPSWNGDRFRTALTGPV